MAALFEMTPNSKICNCVPMYLICSTDNQQAAMPLCRHELLSRCTTRGKPFCLCLCHGPVVHSVIDQADCYFFPVRCVFLFCIGRLGYCGCVPLQRRPTLHWSQHGLHAARSLATCSRGALTHQTMTLAMSPAGPCLSPWSPSQHALHAWLLTHTLPS